MSPIPYSDELIEISDDSIRFRDYYFPRGARTVELSAIERVDVLAPTLLNGRWRIHGTGDLRTWFPRDPRRPTRDRIFVARLRGRWRRIGFTAADADAAQRALAERGVTVSDRRPGRH